MVSISTQNFELISKGTFKIVASSHECDGNLPKKLFFFWLVLGDFFIFKNQFMKNYFLLTYIYIYERCNKMCQKVQVRD